MTPLKTDDYSICEKFYYEFRDIIVKDNPYMKKSERDMETFIKMIEYSNIKETKVKDMFKYLPKKVKTNILKHLGMSEDKFYQNIEVENHIYRGNKSYNDRNVEWYVSIR